MGPGLTLELFVYGSWFAGAMVFENLCFFLKCIVGLHARQVVCSCPRACIFNVIVTGHMLRYDSDAIFWVFREKKSGCQPDNPGTMVLCECRIADGSLGADQRLTPELRCLLLS